MKKLEILKGHLKPGEVYRRANLEAWSNAIDRHLRQLVKDGVLQKLSRGLYYVPRDAAFGKPPAEEYELLTTFLKDDRFVVTSPNDYNALGVGTTQLYNTRRVYNYKRHGNYKLGNRMFHFVRKPYVPDKLTKEFLLVDLTNNLKYLAENLPTLLENVKKKANEMDTESLKNMVRNYGSPRTKRLFASAIS